MNIYLLFLRFCVIYVVPDYKILCMRFPSYNFIFGQNFGFTCTVCFRTLDDLGITEIYLFPLEKFNNLFQDLFRTCRLLLSPSPSKFIFNISIILALGSVNNYHKS